MAQLKRGYHKKLVREINEVLDRLAEKKKQWKADWITNEICTNHEDELTGEALFSRYNNYTNVRQEVNRVMKKRASIKPKKPDIQLVLEGFEYVQNYYMVDRDGEATGVSVYSLTIKEIESKQTELYLMGVACLKHRDELDRFKRQQFPDTGVA